MVELPLPGASVAFDPEWLSPAEALTLFTALRAQVDWQVHRIRLFGRVVDSPRLSSWIGDAGATYRYSGAEFFPRPWPDALTELRQRLSAEAGEVFNSVLANLYRDGRDAMGWHSDNEPELGSQPVIASLSLGAPRRFLLKPVAAARPVGAAPAANAPSSHNRLELLLPPGSLLLMRGETQRNYRHALPRTARAVGERINLTFRRILPAGQRSAARRVPG